MRTYIHSFLAALLVLLLSAACVLPLRAANNINVHIPLIWHQTEARKQLDLINSFRNSSENWYWNSDNSTKTWTSQYSLAWDYDLEKVAMQRAAEIALRYAHERPDGSWCNTAYSELGYYENNWGENIATGFVLDSKEVFGRWREDNDDYSGQGHRRNILGSFGAVACACVEYDGIIYWVQEFSGRQHNGSPSAANDSAGTGIVRTLDSYIAGWQLSADSISVPKGTNASVSEYAKFQIKMNGGWPYAQSVYRDVINTSAWTSQSSDIVSASGNTFRALKRGSAVLTALSPDQRFTLSLTVNVTSSFIVDHWNWAADYSSASVVLKDTYDSSTVTVNADVTSETTNPDCENSGKTVYTASLTYDGKTFTDTKTKTIPALGHDYTITYSWPIYQGSIICFAEAYCSRDSSHHLAEIARPVIEEYDEPTCEEDGRAVLSASFSSPVFIAQRQTFAVEPTGHDWGEPVYTWSSDNKTVTARSICGNDSAHVLKETATARLITTKAATETAEGAGYYYAEFENTRFESQRKTVTIPKLKPAPTAQPAGRIAMHRLYNPNSWEHFYTGNTKEKDALVKMGWKYEGVGWIAPGKSKTPVYRLYNPNNGGDHHYTMNKKEYDALVKAGWKGEGIRWYSDDKKAVPVYREYNPGAPIRNHNYTANKKEHDVLVKTYGWKDEGIGWYGMK